MQKVLCDYENRKKLLNYSTQNPLQSFYKRNFICWLIIAIDFEQRDVIVLSVRHFYITTKTIQKFSKFWQFLFPHFSNVTSYSFVDIWMFKFEFHYLYDKIFSSSRLNYIVTLSSLSSIYCAVISIL